MSSTDETSDSNELERAAGQIFPSVNRIREISHLVAMAVIRQAHREGHPGTYGGLNAEAPTVQALTTTRTTTHSQRCSLGRRCGRRATSRLRRATPRGTRRGTTRR